MPIDLEKRPDGVAIITLNRPNVLNALDIPAKETLGEIWRELAADAAVHVVVLRGAGRAFCAGSDIKEMHRTGRMVDTDTLMNAIPGVGIPLDKPVIGALHGHTLGMGLTLALHCDLRIAQTDTNLAFPEVPHGMLSGVSALRLPDIVGPGKAMEYLLLGRTIPLDEAVAVGLLNCVVDDAMLVAEEWASTIAKAPSVAVIGSKRLAAFRRKLTQAEIAEIDAMRLAVEDNAHFKLNAEVFERR